MLQVVLLLSVSLSLPGFTNAFIPTSPSSSRWAQYSSNKIAITRRNAISPPHESTSFLDDDEDDHFDVEAVRRSLEALLVNKGPTLPSTLSREGQVASLQAVQIKKITEAAESESRRRMPERPQPVLAPPADMVVPSGPFMTSIDRERRLAELNHLARLANGDDAVADLWQLWFQERGSEAAARLEKADELITNQEFEKAEPILRDLIDRYGVHWAEPVNRLATMYHLKGELEKAEVLCKIVLAVKPWHFGALSGIVMVYAAMHDTEQAQMWAPQRLPNFNRSTSSSESSSSVIPNRRRQAWVAQAVMRAEEALRTAEERLTMAFGEQDDHISELVVTNQDEDADAWQ